MSETTSTVTTAPEQVYRMRGFLCGCEPTFYHSDPETGTDWSPEMRMVELGDVVAACGRASCLSTAGIQERQERMLERLRSFECNNVATIKAYIRWSREYHFFSKKVLFASACKDQSKDVCALAHQQYGPQVSNWKQDSFWYHYRRAEELLKSIEKTDAPMSIPMIEAANRQLCDAELESIHFRILFMKLRSALNAIGRINRSYQRHVRSLPKVAPSFPRRSPRTEEQRISRLAERPRRLSKTVAMRRIKRQLRQRHIPDMLRAKSHWRTFAMWFKRTGLPAEPLMESREGCAYEDMACSAY